MIKYDLIALIRESSEGGRRRAGGRGAAGGQGSREKVDRPKTSMSPRQRELPDFLLFIKFYESFY